MGKLRHGLQAGGKLLTAMGPPQMFPGDRSVTNLSQQAPTASLVHLLAQLKPCSLARDL